MELEKSIFGEFLKEYRLSIGLTQKAASEMIGITFCYYNQIENGKAKPGIDTLNKISKYIGIDVKTLRNIIKKGN